ncbi:Lrp/AsnC family transcriptional regulator [Candidatus Woesearchaeota archaeon]|nr:Lrp/AsnC family transcriptional regulator [Candidatus Woesearchaeota archaeon]
MFKRKDVEILMYLRRNCREKLTNIAKILNRPASTVYEKMNNHNGIIQKNVCLIDFKKLGFLTKVKFIIRVWKTDKDKVREFLSQHPNINSLYKINNGFDFLAEGIFEHLRDVEDFREKLETRFKIKENKMYYVIQDIKREEFLSHPEDIELVNSVAA